jgi:hypothetical protein
MFQDRTRNRGHVQWHDETQYLEEQNAKSNRSENRSESHVLFQKIVKGLAWVESFLANLPLTIGAIAVSIANLGVVWFKFAEVHLSSCKPVHFHSSQCSFPEVCIDFHVFQVH